MADRDWFDDFMDYKLSTSSEPNVPTSNGGCLPLILGAIAVLWVITTLFG